MGFTKYDAANILAELEGLDKRSVEAGSTESHVK
jgi:hypothetical protein